MSEEPTEKEVEKKVPRSSDWHPIRNAWDLVERIDNDPWLQEEIKKDPARAIAQISGPPLETDIWIYRIVVIALGLTVLIAVVGSIILASMGNDNSGREVPEVLVALGSAAVGALAGLLAPSPGKS